MVMIKTIAHNSIRSFVMEQELESEGCIMYPILTEDLGE